MEEVELVVSMHQAKCIGRWPQSITNNELSTNLIQAHDKGMDQIPIPSHSIVMAFQSWGPKGV